MGSYSLDLRTRVMSDVQDGMSADEAAVKYSISARYTKNSGGSTHPVGGKKPNEWGLYDMHGNVFEWCQDWYGKYPSGSTTDPTGAASGSRRVLRGGCWGLISDNCRSATRNGNTPDFRYSYLGFRVLRSSIK